MFNKRTLVIIMVSMVVIGLVGSVVLPYMSTSRHDPKDWQGKKDEINAMSLANVEHLLSDHSLDGAIKMKTAQCVTEKVMDFVPTIPCKPIPGDTAENRAKMEACLKEHRFEEKTTGFLVVCLKEHVPNEWKIYKDMLKEKLTPYLEMKVPDPDDRARVSACMLDGTLKMLDSSECKPLNTEADNLIDLLDPTPCLDKLDWTKKLENQLNVCSSDS